LSRRQRINIDELSHERLFMHSRQTTMNQTVQQLFDTHHVTVNVAARLWKFDTIKNFVKGGGGVAIVPLSVVASELESRTLVNIPVNGLDIARSIEVMYRSKDSLLPGPAALLDLLRHWPWRRSVIETGEFRQLLPVRTNTSDSPKLPSARAIQS